MTASFSSSLRLIHPHDYDELDTPTEDDNVAAVLEAAAAKYLDQVQLTDTQAINMTRLFPRRADDTPASWPRRINERLVMVAEDLRPWWERDLGVERDGVLVSEVEADLSRQCAEDIARRLIGGAP